MVRTLALGLSTALVLLWSCASTTPLQTVGAARGMIGAHYEIEVDEVNWGDVRVRSVGVEQPRRDAPHVAQFNLRIRNDADVTLRVDLERTELEISTSDRDLLLIEAPIRHRGDVAIEPQRTGRLDVWFEFPSEPTPKDILGIELSWVITTPAGPFSESTPFVRETRKGSAETRVIYAAPWAPPPGIYPGGRRLYPWWWW